MSRPRILFATQDNPFPPEKGGWAAGMVALLKELHGDYAIDVVYPEFDAGTATQESRAALRAYCENVFPFPCSKRRVARGLAMLFRGAPLVYHHYSARRLREIVASLAEHLPHYRALIFQDTHLAPYSGHFDAAKTARKLFLATDYLTLHFERLAELTRSPYHRFTAARLRRLEPALYRDFESVVYVSTEDHAALARAHPELGDRVLVIRYGFELAESPRFAPPDRDRPPVLVFTGNMQYAPNRLAAEWFANEVFPGVRDRTPEVEFQIVGRRAAQSVRARGPGISIHSDVPDILPYLENATLMVSPLHSGTGVKNKIIETMAVGRAIVGTPLSFDGIPVEANVHASLASDPGEFVSAIGLLLRDRDALDAMAERGCSLIRDEFDVRRSADQWRALIDEGIRTRPGTAPRRAPTLSP